MWRCGRESKSVGKELQTNVENRVKLVILTFALAIIPLVNWCHGAPNMPQPILPASATNSFNFQSVLFGPTQSLSLNVVSVNSANGAVTINGGDTRQPGTPFSWQWGDNSTTSGFFPQTHTYLNTTSNYVVTVTAFYNDGSTGTAQTIVWFATPSIRAVALPSDTSVTIATSPQALVSRQTGYGFSPQLTNFTSTSFGIIPQTTIQYVLTAAAAIPLKRLMQALELFNSNWQSSYDQNEDTPTADSFRATLWVTALSYAFQTDLRSEFEALNFPVSDTTYTNLSTQMAALPDIINTPHQLNIQSLPTSGPSLSINGPIPRFYKIQVITNLSKSTWTNIGNVFNANTNSFWLDPSANNSMRFYRSALLP
jgi:hypothetical protein